MKRLLIAAASLAALAGCTKTVSELSYAERKALAAEIAQRCADQGYADGHPEQAACIRAEVDREVAVRNKAAAEDQRARMALAAGMQGISNSMTAQARRQPINCTSRTGLGGTVTTSCY